MDFRTATNVPHMAVINQHFVVSHYVILVHSQTYCMIHFCRGPRPPPPCWHQILAWDSRCTFTQLKKVNNDRLISPFRRGPCANQSYTGVCTDAKRRSDTCAVPQSSKQVPADSTNRGKN